MTIKKFYQKGKLASVGFDTLEEVFAYNHAKHLLSEVPSNELSLNIDKQKIKELPEFQDFIKRMKKNEDIGE